MKIDVKYQKLFSLSSIFWYHKLFFSLLFNFFVKSSYVSKKLWKWFISCVKRILKNKKFINSLVFHINVRVFLCTLFEKIDFSFAKKEVEFKKNRMIVFFLFLSTSKVDFLKKIDDKNDRAIDDVFFTLFIENTMKSIFQFFIKFSKRIDCCWFLLSIFMLSKFSKFVSIIISFSKFIISMKFDSISIMFVEILISITLTVSFWIFAKFAMTSITFARFVTISITSTIFVFSSIARFAVISITSAIFVFSSFAKFAMISITSTIFVFLSFDWSFENFSFDCSSFFSFSCFSFDSSWSFENFSFDFSSFFSLLCFSFDSSFLLILILTFVLNLLIERVVVSNCHFVELSVVSVDRNNWVLIFLILKFSKWSSFSFFYKKTIISLDLMMNV